MANTKQLRQLEKKERNWFFPAAIAVLIVLLCAGTIYMRWNYGLKETEKMALQSGQIAAKGISLGGLFEKGTTVIKSEKRKYLHQTLQDITKLNRKCQYSYVLVKRGGDLYVIADSDQAVSDEQSLQIVHYAEAEKEYYQSFSSKKAFVAKNVKDRWGTWMSVLVPVIDEDSGKVVAVFGMDYEVADWYSQAKLYLLRALLVCVSLVTVYMAILLSGNLRKKLTFSKEKLKNSEGALHAILEQVPIGIGLGRGHDISGNDRFKQIISEIGEDKGKNWLWEMERTAFRECDNESTYGCSENEHSRFEMDDKVETKQGNEIFLHVIMSKFHFEDNDEYYFLCLIEDITRQKELEKNLLDIERSKAVLLQNLPGMAYRCNYDRDWTMQFISNGCFELTGFEPQELIGNRDRSFNDLILPQYREHLWKQWETILKDCGQLNEEYEIETADGTVKWVYELGQPVFDEHHSVEALEGILIDITKQKEEEYKFKYLSEHDSLTNLYNRRYFEGMMNDNIESFRTLKRQGAVVMIMIHNLNQFNLINGFSRTEKLLIDFTDLLKTHVEKLCSLYHISSERYIYLIEEYGEKENLTLWASKILSQILSFEGGTKLEATIGILELKGEPDVERVLKYASIAAQNASSNPDRICFFCKEMEDELIYKEGIKNALRDYFTSSCGKLVAHYQPIIDVKTKSVYGFEALARFYSNEYGWVSPMDFIPIAEESGNIIELGKEILFQSCMFLCELEAMGSRDITISVNISVIQLVFNGFLDQIKTILHQTGANPHNITLEITESVFLDDYIEMNRRLSQIRDLGMKISIDDFGTGYSSLARERELVVDYLKIDKYFVDKILLEDQEESITADIISMAHKLGHRVIAEGVEEQIQMDYLKEHQCNYVQGYYFSKPLEKKDALQLLEFSKKDAHELEE